MTTEIHDLDQEHEESLNTVESRDDERLAKEQDPRYLFRRKIEERLERKLLLEEFGEL
jgi:hypothetical protein